MALGCGQVDLQVAASETSSLQSSSQKPGTRNRGLASCFFLTMAIVALSPSTTRLCVHVMGASSHSPLYRKRERDRDRLARDW